MAMKPVKIRVLHSYYGRESECCGHVVEIDGVRMSESFEFMHCDNVEEAKEFARSYIESHNPECLVSLDWDTLEFLGDGC